jgi:nucleoside-diphosphate-sugar epimerase
MTRVLVIGGAGFVGTRLVPLLLAKGYNIRVLDNLMYNQIVFLDVLSNPNFEFIRGDITNEEDVKKSLEDVDHIIYLAAIVGAPLCDKEPELATRVNVNGAEIINKLRGRIPIVYTSSGSVYGKLDEICSEESPVNPLSLYAKTKIMGEKLVINSGNYIIFRPATAFGVSPRMRIDLLINNLVYDAIKSKRLVIFEANAKRTFIHVFDFAIALIFAIENFEKMKNKIYNLGNDNMNFTKREVAELIKKYTGCNTEFLENAEDPDKRDYEVSYEKIKSIGFFTKVSVEMGIDELIKSYNIISIRNPYSNQN